MSSAFVLLGSTIQMYKWCRYATAYFPITCFLTPPYPVRSFLAAAVWICHHTMIPCQIFYIRCYLITFSNSHIEHQMAVVLYCHQNGFILQIVCTNEFTASVSMAGIVPTERCRNWFTCLRLQAAWAGVGLVVFALLMRLSTEPELVCCVVGEL
jgi:hypothetical protein